MPLKKRLKPMVSSENMDWETPDHVLDLVRKLSPSNSISLDPCTKDYNPTKADHIFTPEVDGLAQDWSSFAGGLVYINPPYGRSSAIWVKKVHSELLKTPDLEVVMLLAGRIDTRWFQDLMATAKAVCFWKGRLTFKGAKDPALFPSALFYFGPKPLSFYAIFQEYGTTLVL